MGPPDAKTPHAARARSARANPEAPFVVLTCGLLLVRGERHARSRAGLLRRPALARLHRLEPRPCPVGKPGPRRGPLCARGPPGRHIRPEPARAGLLPC